MLAAIQGTRSAEFEPENCMSPSTEGPVDQHPNAIHQVHPTNTSPFKSEQNDTVAPLGSKIGANAQIGIHAVGASRDSPTFISDDDTSYSTWKPVSLVFDCVYSQPWKHLCPFCSYFVLFTQLSECSVVFLAL